ncbi:MAG: DUF3473 domain-containing protein [Phycisphaerae bacterium]|nr:DUF3473 domain-containing protein [Phycisphaerae bacterium]
MRHAITIDVEDWYQSTFDPNAELSERFERNTMNVLEVLAKHNVCGTFFVLGLAAEKSPQIVKAIAGAGHEVQSHGYGHLEVFKQTEDEFRQDIQRAKKMLEDMTGQEIFGYRAPSFSIDDTRTPWALDVLVETGHRYDSSIFPLKKSRYGIDNYPPSPQIVETAKGNRLVEAPVACFDWLGKRRAVGGGGYFRLLPYWVIRKAWRQCEKNGRPGITYMHPYEYDPSEMDAFKDKVSLKMRLHQGLGRKGFPNKVDRLLHDFEFASLKDILAKFLAKLP